MLPNRVQGCGHLRTWPPGTLLLPRALPLLLVLALFRSPWPQTLPFHKSLSNPVWPEVVSSFPLCSGRLPCCATEITAKEHWNEVLPPQLAPSPFQAEP